MYENGKNQLAREANPRPPTRAFLEAEASFLAAIGVAAKDNAPGAKPTKVGNTRNNIRAIREITVPKQNTREFFSSILTDAIERELWYVYLTGKAPKLNDDGSLAIGEDGKPTLVEIELDPISFKAFQLAVQYKRGMPVVKIEEDRPSDNIVEVTVIGATPEFHQEMEKRRKLIGGGV